MFKIQKVREFVKKSGRVCSTITILQCDMGAGVDIIPCNLKEGVAKFDRQITIYAEDWIELDHKEASKLQEIKGRIDVIRDNMSYKYKIKEETY